MGLEPMTKRAQQQIQLFFACSALQPLPLAAWAPSRGSGGTFGGFYSCRFLDFS